MDFESVHQAVTRSDAGWTPKRTPLSDLPPEDRRKYLGFVPAPGHATLLEREQSAATKAAASLAFAVPLPASVDWRSRNGSNFITPVRDQGPCGSCVAFGAIAAMEAQFQIRDNDPSSGIDLSEADLFYCTAEAKEGRACGGLNQGWWPSNALLALQNDGVVDEACFPYTAGDQPCNTCADAASRVNNLSSFSTLTTPFAMKSWLASTGPLVTTINVYDDFVHYGGGIYKHVTGGLGGGHCMCVVGYDDDRGCWILKNSWNTWWGDAGFISIAYGEVAVDHTMYGVQV